MVDERLDLSCCKGSDALEAFDMESRSLWNLRFVVTKAAGILEPLTCRRGERRNVSMLAKGLRSMGTRSDLHNASYQLVTVMSILGQTFNIFTNIRAVHSIDFNCTYSNILPRGCQTLIDDWITRL